MIVVLVLVELTCHRVSPDDVCDELLQLIDLEVTRMKEYYEDNKEMLEKVARRQRLWLDFLELEVCLFLVVFTL